MRLTLLLALFAALAVPGFASAQGMVHIPLTVVSGPAEGDTGTLNAGRFAEHVVQASNAVVTEAPLTVGRITIPAGTALALVAFEFVATRNVYCDVRQMGRWSSADVGCFQDRDGDGRLDLSLRGLTQPGYFAFGVASVGGGRDLAAPVAYREAIAEERPTTRFGLLLCRSLIGSGGFAVTVPLYGSDWLLTPAPCPIEPQRSSDGQTIQFQSLRIAVSEPRDGGSWTIVSAIPPGSEITLAFRRR